MSTSTTNQQHSSSSYNKQSSQYPADALSIHLALEQAERCAEKVPEGKLHFGASGKIIDVIRQKQLEDLKEGALYRLNGQRLKLQDCKKQQAELVY